ncbi:hypothetical protein V1634_10540 [Plantactinospora veratri]|uniref:Uncharacterized protein n=1 Tax=Plantactinospora veratri TaxID=1436122 RepID=A0ABU7SBE2_9ACTN
MTDRFTTHLPVGQRMPFPGAGMKNAIWSDEHWRVVHSGGPTSIPVTVLLMGRPAGMMQLRGTCLPIWEDVLPKQDETQWRAVMRELGAALAADGGTAH